MINKIKNIVWRMFKLVDAKLKFPNLETGEIGLQLGFDMDAAFTSDLFLMHNRVSNSGVVYGIDPDMSNIVLAKEIIDTKHLNIKLINKAVFSNKGTVSLTLGQKAGWNQLDNIPLDSTVEFSGSKVDVEMDTLDNIVNEYNIDVEKIGHVNLTINGSEYFALLGMSEIIRKSENLNITIVAGRYDESGYIDGVEDYKKIIAFLEEKGFTYKFKRIHQLFWWGVIVKLFLSRKWVFGKKNYGVIMASKGVKKVKWFQSFS